MQHRPVSINERWCHTRQGQNIVFGGRRWKIKSIDTEKKVIYIEHAKGESPPSFGGSGMSIHDIIRQEMFTILCEGDYRIPVGDQKMDFIDSEAKELFREAVRYFHAAKLHKEFVIPPGNRTYLFTWLGDKVNHTLATLFTQKGIRVSLLAGGVIEIEDRTASDINPLLAEFAKSPLPSEEDLAKDISEKRIEKFDNFLPDDLLSLGYGAKAFDIERLSKWLEYANDNSASRSCMESNS